MYLGRPKPSERDLPCTPWQIPVLADCCDCVDATTDPQLIVDAQAWAIASVYETTCRRFTGCCRVEVRPCIACHRCGASAYCDCDPCGPYITLDLWEAFCTDRINQVVEVQVDGVAWTNPTAPPDPEYWRLDPDPNTSRGRYLVLQKSALDAWGRFCWPPQDPSCPNGDPGTWSVIADVGTDPPVTVLKAAADLACEYIKWCKDPDNCNLPDRVTSIVRRGTTVNFGDIDGSTGVPTLDMALEQWGCQIADFEYGVDVCSTNLYIPVPRAVACT